MEQESDVPVVDQTLLDTMTETELEKFLHDLFMSTKTFTLHGVKSVYDSNLGPVTTSFGGSSGKPTSHSE